MLAIGVRLGFPGPLRLAACAARTLDCHAVDLKLEDQASCRGRRRRPGKNARRPSPIAPVSDTSCRASTWRVLQVHGCTVERVGHNGFERWLAGYSVGVLVPFCTYVGPLKRKDLGEQLVSRHRGRARDRVLWPKHPDIRETGEFCGRGSVTVCRGPPQIVHARTRHPMAVRHAPCTCERGRWRCANRG